MTAEQALGMAWLISEHKADVWIQMPPRSHWLHVDFPTVGLRFAVWDSTGAVHAIINEMGEVSEDPVYTPGDYDFFVMMKHEKVAKFAERMMEERDAALVLVDSLRDELFEVTRLRDSD